MSFPKLEQGCPHPSERGDGSNLQAGKEGSMAYQEGMLPEVNPRPQLLDLALENADDRYNGPRECQCTGDSYPCDLGSDSKNY